MLQVFHGIAMHDSTDEAASAVSDASKAPALHVNSNGHVEIAAVAVAEMSETIGDLRTHSAASGGGDTAGEPSVNQHTHSFTPLSILFLVHTSFRAHLSHRTGFFEGPLVDRFHQLRRGHFQSSRIVH